jgi:hypothetical protein
MTAEPGAHRAPLQQAIFSRPEQPVARVAEAGKDAANIV